MGKAHKFGTKGNPINVYWLKACNDYGEIHYCLMVVLVIFQGLAHTFCAENPYCLGALYP